MRRVALTVVFLVWGCAAASAKDLTLRERTMIGSRTIEKMQYWSGSKMVSDDDRFRTIVDFNTKTIAMVNKTKKTYSTLTFDEMRRQSEALKKRMESLSPELRKMMGQAEGAVNIKPTGKSEKIAGYEAKEYVIEGGPTKGSIWVAEALDTNANPEQRRQLAGALGGPGRLGGPLNEAMAQLKGLPLRRVTTTTLGTQQITAHTEVLEVNEKAAPADVLKVPDGFKRVTTESPLL